MQRVYIVTFASFSQILAENVYVSRKLAEMFNLSRNAAYADTSHIFCQIYFQKISSDGSGGESYTVS